MTLLHFGEGVWAAQILRTQFCEHIHAHFMDRAATLALVASRLLNISYSFTAHARDIYVDPVLQAEKLSEARFVATCTAYNRDYLLRWLPDGLGKKVKCIYHGLDTSNYQPVTPSGIIKPVLISVGQLKEKKGFTYLLQACRLLKDWGYDFECQIVGDGPLYESLAAQIRQLRLEGVVELCGMLAHQDVIQKYRQASVFVLPAVLAADGDRDGIPNVILEAMAMNLPVVSTEHSGIPEVLENGLNGLLVQPADIHALAKALAYLLDNPTLRLKFGKQGRQTVIEKFDLEHNVGELLAEFKNAALERVRNVQ
jgi:glycosyltransferase involved in cell wall biosynthesis